MNELISRIDTERFGFKVAKITSFDRHTAGIVEELKGDGVRMIIARVKTADIQAVNGLEEMGFRVMDTQLTYRYDLDGYSARPLNLSAVRIRSYENGDLEPIAAIAGKSFDNYGHYFADPWLDREKCREIYRDWAIRSCGDKTTADIVFVAQAGSIAGFATYKIHEKDGISYAACGLGAVDESFRGRGIYGRIINGALEWGKQKGLKWMEYNCLACNFPANISYIKPGFLPVDSFITLHYWTD
jgi:GNAT superfamily N-acetyltransferase